MSAIQCPRCGSEAYNSYGHTKNGKQRYICLVCNRQFVNGENGNHHFPRPTCSRCGKSMHVYMRDQNSIRYRCSQYPDCREYKKLATES